MQREAREQAADLIDILRASCLKNVSISVLADGSFGFDSNFLLGEIRRLAAGGRRPFVHIYLSNGPSQRRWRSTPLKGFGTQIPPEEFRRKLIADPAFEAEVIDYVERIRPLAREIRKIGGVVTLAPALEDNLTNKAFNRFVEIIGNAIPGDLPIQLVRNACTNCYPGNEGAVPKGVLRESHGLTLSPGLKGGLFSNDGKPDMTDLSAAAPSNSRRSQLASLRNRAAQQNTSFFLWSAKRQGLRARGDNLLGFEVPANKRKYPRPTAAEREELMRFLRGE
jgi:hypothetical protein